MSILGFDGRAGFTAPPPEEVYCKILFEPAPEAKVPEGIPALLAPMFPHCKNGMQAYRNPQNPEWVTQLPSYELRSEDRQWKAELTGFTLTLTTWQYPGWYEFVRHLDFLLTQMRQGGYPMGSVPGLELWYQNRIPRPEGGTWRDILQSPYLGPLADGSLPEKTVSRSSLTTCLDLGAQCQLRMTSGLAEREKGAKPEKDRFQLDLKLTSTCRIAPDQMKQQLDWIHSWAVRIFQGAFLRQPLPGAPVPPEPAGADAGPVPEQGADPGEPFGEEVRPEPSLRPEGKKTAPPSRRSRAGRMHLRRLGRADPGHEENHAPDYYDDVLPPDWQQEKTGPVNREVIRKVALIFLCATAAIFLCILGLYLF